MYKYNNNNEATLTTKTMRRDASTPHQTKLQAMFKSKMPNQQNRPYERIKIDAKVLYF